MLGAMRTDDSATEAEGSVGQRLNDSGIELISSASSSSTSDNSWLAQVLPSLLCAARSRMAWVAPYTIVKGYLVIFIQILSQLNSLRYVFTCQSHAASKFALPDCILHL